MRQLWKKVTKWVDRRPTKVKFSKRLIAYVIDWVLGGIITGLPAVFIYAGVTKRTDMFSDLYVFPSLGYSSFWSYLAGILCIVFGLIYFVYIPYKKYPGQTIGKRLMKLKIARIDGKELDLKTLFIRQVCGLMLLEGVSTIVTTYLRQLITLATGFYVDTYLMIVGYAITIVSTVLVFNTPSARSIHDYLAQTTVLFEDDEIMISSKKPKKKKKRK